MKIIGGNPIWTNINNTKERYPSLKSDLDVDVLIVGGGVTGAICGYYFSEAGIKTALIDENLAGLSSTATCTSILQYEIDLDIIGLSKKIGMDKALKSFILCKEAVYQLDELIKKFDIDCSYSVVPALYYSHHKEDYFDMKKEYELRDKAGFNVDFITEDNCDKYVPFPISSGILSRTASSVFDPYLFTIELLSIASSKGLKIFENTKIVDSSENTTGFSYTTNTNFNIKTKKILICTGYNGASLFKEPIAKFSRTFNIVTSPLKSSGDLWYQNMVLKDNKKYYTYIRTTEDNRIIIGGEDIEDLSYDENKINGAYERLEGNFKKLFPHLVDYTIDYKFNGIFADTKDNLPYIGEHPDFKNHYFCFGYGANGIIYSIIGAQLLTKLFNGIYHPDLEIFKFRR